MCIGMCRVYSVLFVLCVMFYCAVLYGVVLYCALSSISVCLCAVNICVCSLLLRPTADETEWPL